jgi:hypothetical protein
VLLSIDEFWIPPSRPSRRLSAKLLLVMDIWSADSLPKPTPTRLFWKTLLSIAGVVASMLGPTLWSPPAKTP